LSLLGWAIIWGFLAIVAPNCPYCNFLGIEIAVTYIPLMARILSTACGLLQFQHHACLDE